MMSKAVVLVPAALALACQQAPSAPIADAGDVDRRTPVASQPEAPPPAPNADATDTAGALQVAITYCIP